MAYKGNAKCIPRDIDAIFLPYQSAWIKDDSILKLIAGPDPPSSFGWTWR